MSNLRKRSIVEIRLLYCSICDLQVWGEHLTIKLPVSRCPKFFFRTKIDACETMFCCSYKMGSERWRSNTCLMCSATCQPASGPKEVLLKLYGNDSDFDREVNVAGSFQNQCPGIFSHSIPISFAAKLHTHQLLED